MVVRSVMPSSDLPGIMHDDDRGDAQAGNTGADNAHIGAFIFR